VAEQGAYTGRRSTFSSHNSQFQWVIGCAGPCDRCMPSCPATGLNHAVATGVRCRVMENPFFEHPILNSPYECPARHWELDAEGQPTQ